MNAEILIIAVTAASLVAACATLVFGVRVSIALATLGGLAMLVPLDDLNASAYLLGIVGNVSAATLLIALQRMGRAVSRAPRLFRSSNLLLAAITIFGVLLYADALALTNFNFYDAGFRGITLPAVMAVAVVVAWRLEAFDLGALIVFSALLFLTSTFTSGNLWNYLIDPVAFLYAAGILAARGVRWCYLAVAANAANSSATRA